jgi:hypothetical protein
MGPLCGWSHPRRRTSDAERGQFGEYRGHHQPDIGEEAVGAHEVEKVYPDIRAPGYETGEKQYDRESMRRCGRYGTSRTPW